MEYSGVVLVSRDRTNTPTFPGGIVKGRATAADPPGAEEFLVVAIDGTSASKLSDLDSLMRDVTFARRWVKTYLDWTGPRVASSRVVYESDLISGTGVS